ncbi:MAG: glutamyl-tRNA reductase [Cryomorphaceae bacterium]|nr:glutamyl-tRNA reductase [Cryomorphaceae bacterium]
MKKKDQNILDHFHVIGISYRSAEVEVREQFSITADKEGEFYDALKAKGLKDVMFISTCNRTEIYFFSEKIHPLVNVWLEITNGDTETLMNAHFHHRGEDALNHLIRVGCGLESQIPGDFEIIMQLRKAFRRAKSAKLANGLFERMLNTAIHTSKQVKHQTAFSTGASSVSYAAVRYLRDAFELSNPNILLVGLGEIGRVTLENLLKHFPSSHISIANRSAEKAQLFAETYEVGTVAFSALHQSVANFDAVIVATGAPTPILDGANLGGTENCIMIDLSVPANIDRNVGALPGITLVDVDALSEITKATLDSRLEMIPRVEKLVEENMLEFTMWYRKRELLPIIGDMTEQLRQTLSLELNLNPLNDQQTQESFVDRTVKRFEADLFKKIEDGVRRGDKISIKGFASKA